jgi:CMP-N,N'-diacetyllegionaminic acid synthase
VNTLIIIIPARGGSKRVPLKNIYPLNKIPLLTYTLNTINECDLNIKTYISTDDERIVSVASDFKNIEIVMRPIEISTDNASTESALLHVLSEHKKQNETPKWVMTLPPTSPFRKASTIKKFIEQAYTCQENIDCLMSVTENRGDFWQMLNNGIMHRLFPQAPRSQQERTPLYEENSAVYVSRTKSLIETGLIFGRVVKGIVIPSIEGFDINNYEDLIIAENIIKSLKIKS